MNERFGFVDKATAQEAIKAFDMLQRSGILSPGAIQNLMQRQPRLTEEPLQFINRSGEEIPRYGCIQITGAEELEDRTIFVAEKPVDTDESAGPFIFNGHHAVPIDKKGTAQRDRVLRAISDGSTLAAGDHWQPVVGDWTIEPDASGRFLMAGSDSLFENACWIFLDPVRCCGGCLLAEDDFNRADGDPGSGWFGDGVIASNVFESDADRTTVCHPGGSSGAFWSRFTCVGTTNGAVYKVKAGDPAKNYTVTLTFSGAVGAGTFNMAVSDGTNTEDFDYDWEYEDEIVIVCYVPEVYLSGHLEVSRTNASAFPNWVTLCIEGSGSDNCWTV